MPQGLPVPSAPGPLEAYCHAFDPLFAQWNQRDRFRRYLEGLLLPTERNKSLTALANTEPIVGAQHPQAQSLQWFLSESTWDAAAVNERRIAGLRADPVTAPTADGVLVIDEHGDRKWGSKTAHIGKQYLANLGKIDTGVVSVTSLWADEHLSYPLHVEPGTLWVSPAHHFEQGKADPDFRTKLAMALELVRQAVNAGIPFRAVPWSQTASTVRITVSSKASVIWARGMCLRSNPRMPGGIRSTRLAPSKKLPRQPNGTGRQHRARGCGSSEPSAMATPRRGGRWRWTSARMAPRSRTGQSSQRPIRRCCQTTPPGISPPICPLPGQRERRRPTPCWRRT